MNQATHAHTFALKSPIIQFLDKIVYWTGIVMVIFANFILSVVLIPFLLAFKGVWLYLALVFIAISFGIVMDAVLRMVQRISQQQLIAELFIPVLALINIYVMAGLTNTLSTKIGLQTTHDALIISLVYVLAFSLPHFVMRITINKENDST